METISKIPLDIEKIISEHAECSIEEFKIAEANALLAQNEYEYALHIIKSIEQLSDQRVVIDEIDSGNEELLSTNIRMVKSLYDEIGYVENFDISVESIGTTIGKILIQLTKIFKKIFKTLMVVIKKLWGVISTIIKDIYDTISEHENAEKIIDEDADLKDAEQNIVDGLNKNGENGPSNEDGYIGFENSLNIIEENKSLDVSKAKSLIASGLEESVINGIISYNYDFINKHGSIDGSNIGLLSDAYKERMKSIISMIEFSGDMMIKIYDSINNHDIPDLSNFLKEHADGIILRDVNYMRTKRNIESGSIPTYKSGLNIISIMSTDDNDIKPVQHKIEVPIIRIRDLIKDGYGNKIKFMTNKDIVNSGFFKTTGELMSMEKSTLKGISRISDVYSTILNKSLSKDNVIENYEKYGLLEKYNMTADKYVQIHMDAVTHVQRIAIQFSNEYKKLAVEINRIQDNLVPITSK